MGERNKDVKYVPVDKDVQIQLKLFSVATQTDLKEIATTAIREYLARTNALNQVISQVQKTL